MTTKFIQLGFGYVEGGHAASITFYCFDAYDSSYQALENLAGCLFKQFLDGVSIRVRLCCESGRKAGVNYCSECGRNLNEDDIVLCNPGMDGRTVFSSWLSEWWKLNNNDISFDEYLIENWWPWNDTLELIDMGLSKDNLFVLTDRSEELLPAFLNIDQFPGVRDQILALRENIISVSSALVSWGSVRNQVNSTSKFIL